MENLFRKSKDFTVEQRSQLLEQFQNSGLSYQEFSKEHNINENTLKNWIWIASRPPGSRLQRTPVERKKIVEAFYSAQSIGMSQKDFAKTWGVSAETLSAWLKKYEEFGSEGLMNKTGGASDKRRGAKIAKAVEDEIVRIKKQEPSFGIKKISHWLYRFRGVKVSPGSVRKTVAKEGLGFAKKPKKRKRSSDRVRRFERARPMQLWQSDITQFTLGAHSMRVYLTVFMDDHSRYIVGWRLQSRQTAELVIDAFKDALTRFGKPEEVLTDQGRQYFAWRGKSELEKLLEKESIKHVVSRAHHPQTLGKCERFWETVSNEFWTRVKPQDLEEARVRIKYFIDHYNHQRPHQGLDGQVPADRFFGIAQEVREAIEKTVEQNALRLAIGELPKQPAFLIGQIGDQRIAFHGTSGRFYLTHENLGVEDGKSNYGNTDISTEGTKNGEHEFSQDACNPGSGVVGSSEFSRAWTSEAESADNHGVLAGICNEDGGGSEIGAQADPVLAADPASDSRNDGGTINSATLQEGSIYGKN